MAFRHEVLHIRRQKQRLIDIPAAKILAHRPKLNQTRSELNSRYSDRLLGLKLSAFTVAVAALTINVGAYTAEIMRAGFEAIPRGQIEAAEGLALSRLPIYWHIPLLPAIEKVCPALTSQFVLLMLASSVCSQISAEELTAVANYIQSDTYRAFETYIIVAVLYIILSLVMRAGFWGLGLVLFPRRRRLGTPL